MSKELENLIPDNPLDCLKVLRTSANTYCSFNNAQCEYNKELANNIEKALKRLEAIDNTNPSKALEALGFIGNYIIPTPNGNEFLKDFCDIELNIIKQALLKAQEQDFNYNKILIPFVNKLVEVLGVKDTDGMTDKIRQQNKALSIIIKEPYQCAPTILYININKNNPKMLNYEYYVMSVKAPLPEEDFDSLKEMILNA